MKTKIRLATGLAALLMPVAALAHGGHGVATAPFLDGLTHPLGGADHVMAMLAVGIWAVLAAAQGQRHAIWTLPLAFLVAMLAGGLAGGAGIGLPAVEPMILASIVVIGAAGALTLRLPQSVAVLIVAMFGAFHGHAHGLEGPSSGLVSYAAGFVLATAALHLAGIALARTGPLMARLLSGGIALSGLALAFVA